MKSSVAHSPSEGISDSKGKAFAGRLIEAVGARKLAPICRAISISGSAMQRYLAGGMPGADIGLRLARELGVEAEWLIEGRGPKHPSASGVAEDFVALPVFDVLAFREYGKPAVDETVPIPRAWLRGIVHSTESLWLTTMPGDAMPDVADEGQTIICRDPEPQLQDGRVYIFSLEGRLLARRVLVRPGGLVLKAGDPNIDAIEIDPEQIEQLIPMARVLAAINVEPA